MTGAGKRGAGAERPSGAPRTYAVGITGHRPNGLQQAELPLLRERLRTCLTFVRDVLAHRLGAVPPLSFVSPLSEGADRLGAEEALKLGFPLEAPLPFERGEYSRDFAAAGSKSEFDELLARAGRIEELHGSRADAPAAYRAAGHAMLDRSDVVLAVWDGAEARGDGGTGQITLEAIHRHLPTIWIRAAAPHEACLLVEDSRHGGFREEPLARLKSRLKPAP